VGFVIIDLDRERSPEQQALVKKFYRGSIPHIVVLDSAGQVVYNASGEVEESQMAELLDTTLKKSRN
jgi:thioredoxin-like negative regulator of GroEL